MLGRPPVIGNLAAAHAMRETMAGEALAAYELLAPLAAADRFSVHCYHRSVKGDVPGLVWNIITVDPLEDTPLTREMTLAGTLEHR